jgi:hypothetical protein
VQPKSAGCRLRDRRNDSNDPVHSLRDDDRMVMILDRSFRRNIVFSWHSDPFMCIHDRPGSGFARSLPDPVPSSVLEEEAQRRVD